MMGRKCNENNKKIVKKILDILDYPKSAKEISHEISNDKEFVSLITPAKSNANLIETVENRVRYYLKLMQKDEPIIKFKVKEKRLFTTNVIKYQKNMGREAHYR
jgi:hypothetical protein